MTSFIRMTLGLFLGLAILAWPFPYQLFPAHLQLVQWGYELFPFTDASALALSSDSRALWRWLGILGILAVLLATVLSTTNSGRKKWGKLTPWLQLLGTYFLAFILLQYGLQKVFKWQFYLPEPNTLYSPLGQLDPDILFWTTMGTNYGYNVFLGLLEFLPACLLLWRRTRLLGLLLALPVLVHVLAINLSFNISVKALSIFLVLIDLWLLSPYGVFLWRMCLGDGRGQRPTGLYPAVAKASRWLKILVIGLLLLEVGWPYLSTGNFQDDLAARPPLHGAYELVGSPLVWPLHTDSVLIRRLFVHRQGYLILQTPTDRLIDYPLELDYNRNEWYLYNAQGKTFSFRIAHAPADRLLQLIFTHSDTYAPIPLRQLNWQELPVLQRHFEWVVD